MQLFLIYNDCRDNKSSKLEKSIISRASIVKMEGYLVSVIHSCVKYSYILLLIVVPRNKVQDRSQ